ncbi:nucleoside-diphosphate-sugar epimerase, putative [Talaromyces islandicus]|uniref:Nucleoside-diphosphate-sugar epimerase, putative n=1 Tax=Talaromyces islandicus TaxID=28573 RepID=A0A0U1LUB9_TALIS|nr:nucleoside-diphosphate-sugar epimerase, putative [Talaromyces islandicus]
MKVLVVGATGMVGGEAVVQCLAHPAITKVIVFVRRDLPADVSDHPKLESVLIKDFAIWPENVLLAHSDAAAMIWAMGTYKGSITADLEYPVTFIESMGQVLETKHSGAPFRFVNLSGKFVRRNQEKRLWLLEKPRKIKGLLETKALAFADSHAKIWETFILKPGGIMTKKMVSSGAGIIGAMMGDSWVVRIEELGAFMVQLAINAEGEESIIDNARIARRGRELLESKAT